MHSLPLLEPIECADWCADGDGHAAAVMRGDQVCWGFESYTSLALEPSDIADGVRFVDQGEVPLRRTHDAAGRSTGEKAGRGRSSCTFPPCFCW